MRVPPFERYVRGMQAFGVFLLGMIVGAVVLHSLFVAQFEALYQTQNELEAKLEEYDQEVKELTKYKNQPTVIKSLQVRVSREDGGTVLDKSAEAELIKRVKADLSTFIGRSIYEIDSDAKFARRLLERNVYVDVYGKDYAVEIQTVLLAEYKLQIWMTAKPVAKPPTS
ncbi:hypothetical protein [Paenibacillus soyae]|uniref:Sporulation membrane protein YtrI C-terminal domain-containing protein n=1 Tax=Paenibacillus soyae TaxID=2969249 RepID=A0A9X2MRE7_9BACL|nr:hypothetical protein [Paenibacillus soyae]MCR2802557.1 hypothetical protein [Paenibacillus soyae]